MNFSFSKAEKLKSRTSINALFQGGKSVKKYPVVLVYQYDKWEENVPVKAGFSAPKKKFKKAVDRNRIKRLMREAYRLHKHALLDVLLEKDQKIAIMFLFVGKEMPDFSAIEKKIKAVLERLKNDIEAKDKKVNP